MLMIQFVIFGIVTSVTISSDDLLFCILISGNWDSASGCLKGELVLTITPAGTQNEPSVVLLFYSSNMNIIFCHVLYSPPISMLVNRVFEISGELQAELVLTTMPDAPWVSSYCRIQSICCYAYVTMTLEAECRRFGDLVVAGGTMSFQNDSLWCHQWQRGCRVDDLLFSVWFMWNVNNFKLWSFQAFKWDKINNLHGIQWIDMSIYIMIHTFWFMCVPICCRVSEVNKYMIISHMLIIYAWIISHLDVLINLNSFCRCTYKS